MIFDSGNAIDRFRAVKLTTYVHRPKRCACGKTAHAKQLKQYGACNACATKNKADASGNLVSASDQSLIGVANV
jgi:hypothetical protein